MTEQHLIAQIRRYVKTPMVVLGKERMEKQIRMKDAGLVLYTSDLSRNATKQLQRLCLRKNVPVFQLGTAALFEEITGYPNVKVLTLRSSFPGLQRLLQEIEDSDSQEEDESF
ncbi:MAG: hypothetical protein D6820_14415 [Lentisphaerae bacterium]|nr:MAG: hypothetical protein D6820_14415 [Lentisphaerota bacterium]